MRTAGVGCSRTVHTLSVRCFWVVVPCSTNAYILFFLLFFFLNKDLAEWTERHWALKLDGTTDWFTKHPFRWNSSIINGRIWARCNSDDQSNMASESRGFESVTERKHSPDQSEWSAEKEHEIAASDGNRFLLGQRGPEYRISPFTIGPKPLVQD